MNRPNNADVGKMLGNEHDALYSSCMVSLLHGQTLYIREEGQHTLVEFKSRHQYRVSLSDYR